MGLPGIPGLATDFGITPGHATQTLTLFLLGFSLGPIAFGPLSDHIGRKPVLLAGLTLFVLAAAGCATAHSMHSLLAFRAIQGVGAGAAAALPAAIIRDVFEGHKALGRQSCAALINALAPLTAPLIGAAILIAGNWRLIYIALALAGALLFCFVWFGYAETAPNRRQNPSQAPARQSVLAVYRRILADRQFLFTTAILAACFGTMFSYIGSSSVVFMGQFGVSATTYSALFAFMALGEMGGAACNTHFARQFGASRMLHAAIFAATGVTLLLLLLALSKIHSFWLCAVLVVLSNSTAGIIMPTATYLGMENMGTSAGSAAALQRTAQMVTGAMASLLVGLWEGPPLIGMATTMLSFSALSILLLIAARYAGCHLAASPNR